MLYLPREEGQGLVEYALILVLIAVVVIVLLTLVGDEVRSTFSRIASGLDTKSHETLCKKIRSD